MCPLGSWLHRTTLDIYVNQWPFVLYLIQCFQYICFNNSFSTVDLGLHGCGCPTTGILQTYYEVGIYIIWRHPIPSYPLLFREYHPNSPLLLCQAQGTLWFWPLLVLAGEMFHIKVYKFSKPKMSLFPLNFLDFHGMEQHLQQCNALRTRRCVTIYAKLWQIMKPSQTNKSLEPGTDLFQFFICVTS